MFDFNKYDDAALVNKYDGFIDRLGNFYKVAPRGLGILNSKGEVRDSHNEWAEHFMKEVLNIKKFKINPSISMVFTLSKLNGPAEILVNCLGYVYYSHEPVHYRPIIKVPNPKMFGFKVTNEQLDMLYSIMVLNKENTNINIFFAEDDYEDYGDYGDEYSKVLKK